MLLGAVLIHFFAPHTTNNQRAKLIHNSTLMAMAFFMVLYQLLLVAAPRTNLRILGYKASISIDEVVRLTNERRAEAGFSPLQNNVALAAAAEQKGNHMLEFDYWAHVAPDGTEPWSFFTNAGYEYRYAGENLARDFTNAGSAVEAWMASPTHKDNILSSKYSEIGIAVVEGDFDGVDTTIIVQFFATPLAGDAGVVPVARASESQTTTAPSSAPAVAAVAKEEVSKLNEEWVVGPTTSPAPVTAVPQPTKAPNVLISPFSTTRMLSLVITSLLFLVLVIDGVIVSRRRISRVGGRTFAHLAFLGMILSIALILKAGRIL